MLAGASAVLLGAWYLGTTDVPGVSSLPGLPGVGTPAAAAPEEKKPVDPEVRADVRAEAEKFLESPVTLTIDGTRVETTWKALGLRLDDAALEREAERGGSDRMPVALDRQVSLEALVGYKDSFDRPPVDAKMDLDKRIVLADADGYGVHVYESIAVLEEAAQAAKTEVALAGDPVKATVTKEKLGAVDISHVLASYETHYPVGEKDRNYNLKLAAEKVNGHILMPGEEFSFNAVVGDRTEKEGFRVAHVIAGGEMIDGLAGGTCQISSTLHAAAWFAGLSIVKSTPHSRPSAYIALGLDATVVYPTTDLKLSNPYDFPIVLHYLVAQGTVKVEILGAQERPFEKVTYERHVKSRTPYETEEREDPKMPIGATVVEQGGFDGYKITRTREFWKDGKVVNKETTVASYPATKEIIRVGTNPDLTLEAPEQPKNHGPMKVNGTTAVIEQ